MILRSFQVESWGCFVESVRVGPFSEGINIVSGPNEAGKSTLTEALARGLFDRRTVTGSEASDLRPWGRDVGPQVVIDFAQDGTEYRIEKRFLVEPCAKLFRAEGGRFVLLAEADVAEARVRGLFDAQPPGRGMTKPEHWGVAQLQFARQGGIRPQELGGETEGRLRRTLGAMAEGAGGGSIEKRIVEEYQKVYTDSGTLKKGKDAPAWVGLTKRREGLAAGVALYRRELVAIEALRRTLEDLRRARKQYLEERRERGERLKALQEQEKTYARLAAEAQRLQSEEEAKRGTFEVLDRRIKALEGLKREREETVHTRELADAQTPALEQAAAEATTHHGKAQDLVLTIRAERENLERLAAEVDDARALDRALAQERDLTIRLKKIDDAQARLDTIHQKLSALVAPDKREMAAIRKAIEARNQARTEYEASQIALEIEAEAPIKVDRRSLKRGETHTLRGERQIRVRIQGVAAIRASGPDVSGENLKADYDRLELIVQERTRPHGTDDLERLERLADARGDLAGNEREVQKEIDALAGEDAPDDLRAALARARAEKDAVLGRYRSWRNHPPDVHELEVALKAEQRNFARRIDEAEQDLDLARKAERTASEKLTTARGALAESDRILEGLGRRDQAERLDGLEDAARATARDAAALAWRAARVAREEALKNLETFPEDPAASRHRAEIEIERIEAAEREAIGQEKMAEGELSARNQAGAYSALARAEEELAMVDATLARETERAEGIKLLFESLREEREVMISAMIAPVRSKVERNLRRIAGPGHEQVRFGSNGLPCSIKPSDSPGDVSLELLSGGTEEQLYFVTRLALAEVLAAGQRTLVMFDDPLVNSDLNRIARSLPIIEEAARSLQIVIFTCHPEAYRGLSEPARFEIGGLRPLVEKIETQAPPLGAPRTPTIRISPEPE